MEATEPTYAIWLGWTTYRVGKKMAEPKFIKEGIAYLNYAVTINPKAERAFFFLGKIQIQEHNYEKAEKYFRKALAIDAAARDTLLELKRLKRKKEEMETRKSKKGLFKKIFKSK